MLAINLAAVVLVVALFTQLHERLPLPAWLSPLRLDWLVGVLGTLQPCIQKGESWAIPLGYLVVVLLLCHASVLVLLTALHNPLPVLSAALSGRYFEQVAVA